MSPRHGQDPVGGGWTFAAVVLIVGLTLFGIVGFLLGWWR